MDLDGFKTYLVEKELSKNTIDSYMTAIKQFSAKHGTMSKANAMEYKLWLSERMKPATVNLRCCAVNAYCEYIGKTECKVKGIKTERKFSTENVISIVEYQLLTKSLLEDGDVKGYWMVRFLGETGARVSELIGMKTNALDKGVCKIWNKGRERQIFIPTKLAADFKPENNGYIITNRYGKKMTSRGVAWRLWRMSERYGIKKEKMHPHSFRHFFAIQFLRSGGELTLLSDILGHSNIGVTAIYTRLSQEEQKRKVDEIVRW